MNLKNIINRPTLHLGQTPYLLLGWVIVLALRFALAEGSRTPGAYVTFFAFWIVTVALIVVSILHLIQQRDHEPVQHVLILVAFASFIGSRAISNDLLTHLFAIVFFGCAVGLIVIYGRRFLKRPSTWSHQRQ
jgi:chromate transport protein ChrA